MTTATTRMTARTRRAAAVASRVRVRIFWILFFFGFLVLRAGDISTSTRKSIFSRPLGVCG